MATLRICAIARHAGGGIAAKAAMYAGCAAHRAAASSLKAEQLLHALPRSTPPRSYAQHLRRELFEIARYLYALARYLCWHRAGARSLARLFTHLRAYASANTRGAAAVGGEGLEIPRYRRPYLGVTYQRTLA